MKDSRSSFPPDARRHGSHSGSSSGGSLVAAASATTSTTRDYSIAPAAPVPRPAGGLALLAAASQTAAAAAANTTTTKRKAAPTIHSNASSSSIHKPKNKKPRRGIRLPRDKSEIVGLRRDHRNGPKSQKGEQNTNAPIVLSSSSSSSLGSASAYPALDQALAAPRTGMAYRNGQHHHYHPKMPPRANSNDKSTTTTRDLQNGSILATEAVVMPVSASASAAVAYSSSSIPPAGLPHRLHQPNEALPLLPPNGNSAAEPTMHVAAATASVAAGSSSIPPIASQQRQRPIGALPLPLLTLPADEPIDEQQQQLMIHTVADLLGASIYGPVGSPPTAAKNNSSKQSTSASPNVTAAAAAAADMSSSPAAVDLAMQMNNLYASVTQSPSRPLFASAILPPLQIPVPLPPPPQQDDDAATSSSIMLQAVEQVIAKVLSPTRLPPPPLDGITTAVHAGSSAVFENTTLVASLSPLSAPPRYQDLPTTSTAEVEQQPSQPPLTRDNDNDANQIVLPPPSSSSSVPDRRHLEHHEWAAAVADSGSSSHNPSLCVGNSSDTTSRAVADDDDDSTLSANLATSNSHDDGPPTAGTDGPSSASLGSSLLATPLGSSVGTARAAADDIATQSELHAPVAANTENTAGLSTTTATARMPRKRAANAARKNCGDETDTSKQHRGNKGIVISSIFGCLVQPQDRDLISDQSYLLMQQFIPCSRRRKGNYGGGYGTIGERGLCCKHCQGHDGDGNHGALFFRTNAHTWADKRTRERMLKHIQECNACPPDIQRSLSESQNIVGKFGNSTKFFERILKRLKETTTTSGENGDGPIQAKEQRRDSCDDVYNHEESRDGETVEAHDPTCLKRRHQSTTVLENGGPIPANEQHGDACVAIYNKEEIDDEVEGGHDPTCLVRPEDLDLVSERVYLMMQQFTPGTNSLSDPKTIARGIVCKHCVGDSESTPGGRYFTQSGESLRKSHSHILKHVTTCKHCPKHIKDKMCQLESQDLMSPKSGHTMFYQRIIDRVHGKWTKDADHPIFTQRGKEFRVPQVYDHPIFTQRGKEFRVSQVYNAWCHEIDQKRAKGVSKAQRVRKIVTAVDSIANAIDFNVADILKCFDELQMERCYSFTTVADHIDEFKGIVKGRLRGCPRSLVARQSVQQKGRPKKAPLESSAIPHAIAARRRVTQNGPQNGSRTVVKRPKLLLESDPEEVYIEERAFLFHDPKESLSETPNEELVYHLKPLPPPFAHPTEVDFPPGSAIRWTYFEESRVLLADFSQVHEESLTKADIDFLAAMFERDDITCISQGLLDPARLQERLWDLDAIRTTIGYRTHHKFKRFQQVGDGEYVEMDGLFEMRIEQYFNYSERREAALDGTADSYLVISTPGQPVLELDVVKDVLYMIDLDMPKFLPRTFDDFVSNFKMKEILPGGKWCMMNALPISARPFMGPNMYITPGGGFTQLHQDGHGTCDSGHLALSGYNEVVMLRRLPERHKVEACKHLPNVMDAKGNTYDGMYGLPHDQANGPGWPTQDTITYWKSMNYCPSVFILTAGQHVHINKGRLHAFRKLTPEKLPNDDCHCQLRDAMIKEKSLTNNVPTCVSIAWDWQFGGVHAEGIHRESVAILESALLVDQKDGCKCLAIPKAALLALGRQVLRPESSRNSTQQRLSLIDRSIIGQGFGYDAKPNVIDNTSVARGILPALRFLVKSNIEMIKSAVEGRAVDKENNMRRGKVSVAHVSDCNINPAEGTVEPDGQDYFCKICHSELANLYFHCDGCEVHLKKDFNICIDCHQREAWRCTYQMCPSDARKKSTINHTGDMSFQRPGTRCPCKKGESCRVCGFCTACSCVCHSAFTLHRRYYDEDVLMKILRQVEETGSEPLKYAEFTEARLLSAADRSGAGLASKRALLAEYPRNKEQTLRILANGGNVGDGVGDDDDASEASSMSCAMDFSEQGEGDHEDDDHEPLDDRKMPAIDMQDEIAILDSDAHSTHSSIMQSSTSTTGSVSDDAAGVAGVVNDSNCASFATSIPKEIYASAATAAEECCVMEVEEASPRHRRKVYDV